MRVLKISRRFSAEYVTALKNYNMIRVQESIEWIHQVDLYSKGINYNMSKDKEGELLRELVFKIMQPNR